MPRKKETIKVYLSAEDAERDLGFKVVVGHTAAAELVGVQPSSWRPMVWREQGVPQPIEGVRVARSGSGGQMLPVYRKSDLEAFRVQRELRIAQEGR